jgi:hypothetical protein
LDPATLYEFEVFRFENGKKIFLRLTALFESFRTKTFFREIVSKQFPDLSLKKQSCKRASLSKKGSKKPKKEK